MESPNSKDKEDKEIKQIGNYIFLSTLGAGSFGKVKLAADARNGEKVAIKIVDKSSMSNVEDVERIYRETFILTSLRHPNIIKLYEVLDTPKAIMLVMEYAGGGELFQYISAKPGQRLDEIECQRLFQQIVDGVDYCHRAKVIHRDLKLENILLDSTCAFPNVKIADFGLSNTLKFGQKSSTNCGTPSYTSPEQINGKKYVGNAVDIWAMGVILFAMICGFLPFEAPNIPTLFKKIKNRQFVMPDYITKEAASLIDALLTVDAEKRPTLSEVRNHPWMQMHFTDLIDTIEEMPPVTNEQIAEARAACVALTGDDDKAAAQFPPRRLNSKDQSLTNNTSDKRINNRPSNLSASTPQNNPLSTPSPLVSVNEKKRRDSFFDKLSQPKGRKEISRRPSITTTSDLLSSIPPTYPSSSNPHGRSKSIIVPPNPSSTIQISNSNGTIPSPRDRYSSLNNVETVSLTGSSSPPQFPQSIFSSVSPTPPASSAHRVHRYSEVAPPSNNNTTGTRFPPIRSQSPLLESTRRQLSEPTAADRTFSFPPDELSPPHPSSRRASLSINPHHPLSYSSSLSLSGSMDSTSPMTPNSSTHLQQPSHRQTPRRNSEIPRYMASTSASSFKYQKNEF